MCQNLFFFHGLFEHLLLLASHDCFDKRSKFILVSSYFCALKAVSLMSSSGWLTMFLSLSLASQATYRLTYRIGEGCWGSMHPE